MEENDTPERGDLLALYGTLMQDFDAHEKLSLRDSLNYEGDCVVGGVLLDLGGYPGLVPGEGDVHAELYRVMDSGVFERLDAYEGYRPGDPDSLYVRRRVPLVHRGDEAWIYVYNGDREGSRVPGGDWRER